MNLVHSLRGRWLTWQAVLLVGLVCAFGITASRLDRTTRLGQIDDELGLRVSELASDVRTPPGLGNRPGPPDRRPGEPWSEAPTGPPGRPRGGPRPSGPPADMLAQREIVLSEDTLRLFEVSDPKGFYYGVWAWNGNQLGASADLPQLNPPPPPDDSAGLHFRMRDGRREAFLVTELGDLVLVGRAVAADLAAMRRFNLWLVAAGVAILTVGLGGGWLLTDRAVRPIEDISRAAQRIADGDLAERVAVRDPRDEVGRLAGVLNTTFSRLEGAFARQRQFTADAAHELRTPIAVLISEAQTALARPREPDEYRETIQTCLDAAQQMRALTQSLLELARWDDHEEPLDLRPVDLAALVEASVDQVRPLADRRRITLESDLAALSVRADPIHLRRLILNLLLNAVDYNRNGGAVRVQTRLEGGVARLEVSDTGVGIAPEDLPHVFARFYRADKARSRAESRSGLGLAICRAIVAAHHGTIALDSQLGTGTRVTVTLPENDGPHLPADNPPEIC